MTIKELHDQLYDSLTPKSPRLFIEAYESNILFFNNINLSNLENYSCAMRMTSDYAIILEDLGYLKKGLVYLDKAISLIEGFPENKHKNLFDLQYYELVKFHKAQALFNLKKYNESLKIFYELNNAFPNNDKYLGWIYGIKGKKINIFSWLATGMILFVLIFRLFFKDKLLIFDKASLLLLIICLLLVVIIEIIKQVLKQKMKKFNTA